MRSVSMFFLILFITFLTYSVMNKKLKAEEITKEVKFKVVPEILLNEQYDFKKDQYFNEVLNTNIIDVLDRRKEEENLYNRRVVLN